MKTMNKLNVLIACEESQAVTKAFRELGHNAFSCDIVPCSGGHDEWHIQKDVLNIINGNCTFKTDDSTEYTIVGKWDLVIAFPPCTHLAVSGARHFEKKREDGRQTEAIEFFGKILNCDCNHLAVENPVNIISGEYIKTYFPLLAEKYGFPLKPTQKIQPYEFGNPSKKTTCLWLKNLPNLVPTEIVEPKLIQYQCKNGKTATFSEDYCLCSGDRAVKRSKTYTGVARAMAEQWSSYLLNHVENI